VLLIFATWPRCCIHNAPVPSSRRRACTVHRPEQEAAAATLKEQLEQSEKQREETRAEREPGATLNNAPDNVRNLATLMLKGNCKQWP
jgi:hypothetical protein